MVIPTVLFSLNRPEELLKDTYGITVYQEQVMLLSQKLAGFSKGDADVLRKAMGKKDRYTLDKMKGQFIAGATAKGLPSDKLEKIWTDWEKFAQYAFNKSHSTCYAFVAFQTAYLKAHYPAEFMASVLTHNLSNIDKVTFFMEEAKRMGIPVLGPDVNESDYQFTVNKKGGIRFGMGAVKGVGEAAVNSIIDERKANGPFKNAFDLVKRINLRTANKKTFESLVYSGGFDSFENMHRSQYFSTEGDGVTFIEKLLRFGAIFQEGADAMQQSLFGEAEEIEMPEPVIPVCAPWGSLEKLKFEKDVVGIYISGHPLDMYRIEMDLSSHKIAALSDLSKLRGRDITIAGLITSVQEKTTKNGNLFGTFNVEDYNDTFQFALFSGDYRNFRNFIVNGTFIFIKGKVDTRWNQADQLEFKIQHMQLLSEAKDKLLKSITLSCKIEQINGEMIEQLNKVVLAHSGKCTLNINIEESFDNLSVQMASRKHKVAITAQFITELNKLNLVYKLN